MAESAERSTAAGHRRPDAVHVLHIGGWPRPFGGVTTHVRRLANACHEAGIETTVFDPYNPGSEAAPAPFPVERPTGPRARRVWLLLRRIRGRRTGWVHFHASRLAALSKLAPALLAARRPGCSYAVTIHGSLGDSWSGYGPATRALSRLFLRRVALVIAVSESVRRVLIDEVGVSDDRIAVVPGHLPPLEAERDGGLADLGPLVDRYRHWRTGFGHQALTTGAVRTLYGFALVERAAADERLADVGFVVSHYGPTGDGANRAADRAADPGRGPSDDPTLLDRLRARQNVFLIEDAPVPAYFELLATSDVFLRPSLEDGDSIALREAIDEGVPVVASDCVERPAGTALFSDGDADDLAAAIVAVLTGRVSGRGTSAPSNGARLIDLYHRSYTGREGPSA